MFLQYPPGFIWLLAIIISHVIPAFWPQHIYGKEHRAYNSSAYKPQHVFSGLWQLQHLHKAVYLWHFGKERSQQISIHGNNLNQREKYHPCLQQYYLDTLWPHDVIRKATRMDIIFQQHASSFGLSEGNLHHDTSARKLNSPRAGPLAQQRRQLILTTDVHTDIA